MVERKQLKPFADWIREARNGSLHAELSEGLADVVQACGEHGKAGSLTLKVTIKPDGSSTIMFVTDEVKLTMPTADRPRSIFFADAEGNLQRTDPNQLTFEQPLREVPKDEPKPTTETKEISG